MEGVRGTSDSDVFYTVTLRTSATSAPRSAVPAAPAPATAEKQCQTQR